MERKGIERFAPLTGVLFLVLAIVSFVLGGDPPDNDESPLKHVEFWKDNDGEQMASALVATYAAVFLVWFAASVREAVARAESGAGRLAAISYGGAVIAAGGLLANNAIQFAAAETAGDMSADGTETLSLLYSDFFFPMAAGIGLFLVAAGLAAVRHGAFDKRLGWMAVVIGVICVTPAGFFGFLASMVWIGITAVVLYRKTDPVGSGAAPPPAGPEAPSAPA